MSVHCLFGRETQLTVFKTDIMFTLFFGHECRIFIKGLSRIYKSCVSYWKFKMELGGVRWRTGKLWLMITCYMWNTKDVADVQSIQNSYLCHQAVRFISPC